MRGELTVISPESRSECFGDFVFQLFELLTRFHFVEATGRFGGECGGAGEIGGADKRTFGVSTQIFRVNRVGL